MNQIQNYIQIAVKAALDGRWQEAIEANKTVLKEEPKNIQALNRLGFAYMQLSEFSLAKQTYSQVIRSDKFNPIATKCLDRLAQLESTKDHSNGKKTINPTPRHSASFLEEPGKTKTISLVRPGQANFLFNLNPGDLVNLISKKKRVSVESLSGEYIGCIPDDIGLKLAKLIIQGYQYKAYIKSANSKQVSIFVREISRPSNSNHQPSFQQQNPITRNSNTRDIPFEEVPIDVTPTGEEENPDLW